MTQRWDDELDRQPASKAARVEETPCPACGQLVLTIEWRLTARPIGKFSLAGSQMKVSAKEAPWLVCRLCGIEVEGSLSG